MGSSVVEFLQGQGTAIVIGDLEELEAWVEWSDEFYELMEIPGGVPISRLRRAECELLVVGVALCSSIAVGTESSSLELLLMNAVPDEAADAPPREFLSGGQFYVQPDGWTAIEPLACPSGRLGVCPGSGAFSVVCAAAACIPSFGHPIEIAVDSAVRVSASAERGVCRWIRIEWS